MEEYRDKNILIVGMARSGMASAKTMRKLGAHVYMNDSKSANELNKEIKELESDGVNFYLGESPDALLPQMDMIVVSPGVPLDAPFVSKATKLGLAVVGEMELAYRLCSAPIIAITGTNGKTTTTTLVGRIIEAGGYTTHVVGNIGIPFIDKVLDIDKNDVVVVEASSFQLESVDRFKPHIGAILNITEDHLDRHKTMEKYMHIKGRIFENQDTTDYMVINADDYKLKGFIPLIQGEVVMFGRNTQQTPGVWIEEGHIVMDMGRGKEKICLVEDVFIPGAHNLENALAATAISGIMDIAPEIIGEILKTFKGVSHRIEFVDNIEGVNFYNDSKGTNPDAAIKAIQAMRGHTIVIAGGMDKGTSFDSFIEAFDDKVIHMVVLGETADKLILTARRRGFSNIHRVNSIEEAVLKAFSLATQGENILLSPACASWDMFASYEERGEVFKEAVRALRR